jgi:hypothetical protein
MREGEKVVHTWAVEGEPGAFGEGSMLLAQVCVSCDEYIHPYVPPNPTAGDKTAYFNNNAHAERKEELDTIVKSCNPCPCSVTAGLAVFTAAPAIWIMPAIWVCIKEKRKTTLFFSFSFKPIDF